MQHSGCRRGRRKGRVIGQGNVQFFAHFGSAMVPRQLGEHGRLGMMRAAETGSMQENAVTETIAAPAMPSRIAAARSASARGWPRKMCIHAGCRQAQARRRKRLGGSAAAGRIAVPYGGPSTCQEVKACKKPDGTEIRRRDASITWQEMSDTDINIME